MPTYNYVCSDCGFEFSVFRGINDSSIDNCPKCQSTRVERVITGGTGMIFKGDGFYITDYVKKNSKEKEIKDNKQKEIKGNKQKEIKDNKGKKNE